MSNSFQLTSTTTATLPFTIGLAFVKGEIPTGVVLNVSNYQSIVKRLWNDGSVKHTICSGRVALTANVATTITATNGTAQTGSNLTSANITAAAPSASVALSGYGTVNLSSLLASPFRTWISGHEMVECHYRSAVGSDPTLQVWFHVRLYIDGRMWIRASIENGYLDVTPADKSYVPTVTIGGSVVYNNGGAALAHYGHTRWAAEGWINGNPQITPTINATYLVSTKLVPNYGWHAPSEFTLNSITQTYVPMTRGDWTPAMGQTGFQWQIGILGWWDSLFCANTAGDARAYRSMIANSFCINSYPIVWADSTLHTPVIPSNWLNWTLFGEFQGGATSVGTAGGLAWDVAHHGSAAYVAYLVTGDYFHLETMQYQCSLNYLVVSADKGAGNTRVLRGQTRAAAWAQRTVGQLAAVAPLDTITTDWRTLLANNATHWKSESQLAGQNLLGYIYTGEMGAYGQGGAAPWQQHFFVQTYGYVSDLEPLVDMTDWNVARDWMYRSIVGILGPGGSGNYCFTRASQYFIIVTAGYDFDTTVWYDSWETVDIATWGSLLACSNTLGGESGGAPDQGSFGYWGNLMPAIAYAVDHGASGASTAYTRLTGATNWTTVLNSGFDDTPIWGVIPRAVGSSLPLISVTDSTVLSEATTAALNPSQLRPKIAMALRFPVGTSLTYFLNASDAVSMNDAPSINRTGTQQVSVSDTTTVTTLPSIILPGASTPLEVLAASMLPGAWAELTTNNLNVFQQAGSAGNILDYAGTGAWDPLLKKFFCCGSDHIDSNLSLSPKTVVYDAASNTWTDFGNPPWGIAGHTDHCGYRAAIDQSTSTVYYKAHPSDHWKYAMATNTWTQLPAGGSNEAFECAAFFPALNSYIYMQPGSGNIYRFNVPTQTWSILATNLANMSGPTVSIGNISNSAGIFVTGQTNYFWRLNSAGQTSAGATAPFNFTDGSGVYMNVVADPVTGHFVVLTVQNRVLYTYDAVANTWTATSSTNKPNLVGWDMVGAPVSNANVIMYVAFAGSTGKVWLYKHNGT